jgi:hypothetical protein
MKPIKYLVLCLLSLWLMYIPAQAGLTSYSFYTTTGANASGNSSVGCMYDPKLDALFVGQYFTGVGSRSNILGWSMDKNDPTFGTETPKYYIRERIYANGLRIGGLKSVLGQETYFDGKLYTTSDRWGYDSLNFVPRLWVPVNPDGMTITFPYVSEKAPLYNVTGISTTASTAFEDTYNTAANVYAGSDTVTFQPILCESDGFKVLIGGDQALVGVSGVWTDSSGKGPNFYTGGGYSEPAKSIWLNTRIPDAPRTVYVSYSLGHFNPNTGVIDLKYYHTPGKKLFCHVGQLQPGQRGVWKWDATTLEPEPGYGIFGVPVLFETATVASIATASNGNGDIEVGVPNSKVTDQYLGSLELGANCARARLTYTSYGQVTVGPIVSSSVTQLNLNLNGKPFTQIIGIYTDTSLLGTNFWSRRTCAEWVPVKFTRKIACPWGPISRPTGIYTDANRAGINFLTGFSGSTETTSFKSGGQGGWWNVSADKPLLYTYTGGIDTTLSRGSAFVVYEGELPDNYTPGIYNPMDTTGIIILTNPLPNSRTNCWIVYNMKYGLDILHNYVLCNTNKPLTAMPPIKVGDMVYVSMLAQGGTNPYNFTGPGTAGNRAVGWNTYGVTFDRKGNMFTTSLWSYIGWQVYDKSGNLIARYPVKGARSTVGRGAFDVDRLTGDVYWGDSYGVVWRFRKTGTGLDTYYQEDEPFYVGSVLGGDVDGGAVTGLRVKTVYNSILQDYISLVFINTSYNQSQVGNNVITVLLSNGVIDNKYTYNGSEQICPRGLDINSNFLMSNIWAASSRPYSQVYIWADFYHPLIFLPEGDATQCELYAE